MKLPLFLLKCFLELLVVLGLSISAVPSALGPLAISTSAMTGRMALPGVTGLPGNSVLLVSNLNPDVRLTCAYATTQT